MTHSRRTEWPSWFPDEAAMRRAMRSPVAARLIEDEPRFRNGVTGLTLGPAEGDDGTGGAKVFIMGRRRPGTIPAAGNAGGLTCATIATVTSTTRRDAPWAVPAPPDTILTARFASLDQARAAVASGALTGPASLDTGVAGCRDRWKFDMRITSGSSRSFNSRV